MFRPSDPAGLVSVEFQLFICCKNANNVLLLPQMNSNVNSFLFRQVRFRFFRKIRQEGLGDVVDDQVCVDDEFVLESQSLSNLVQVLLHHWAPSQRTVDVVAH